MSDLNIYQRINAVMTDCEYLQKKKADKGKGIKYAEEQIKRKVGKTAGKAV